MVYNLFISPSLTYQPSLALTEYALLNISTILINSCKCFEKGKLFFSIEMQNILFLAANHYGYLICCLAEPWSFLTITLESSIPMVSPEYPVRRNPTEKSVINFVGFFLFTYFSCSKYKILFIALSLAG